MSEKSKNHTKITYQVPCSSYTDNIDQTRWKILLGIAKQLDIKLKHEDGFMVGEYEINNQK